jgi:hypothetical protein
LAALTKKLGLHFETVSQGEFLAVVILVLNIWCVLGLLGLVATVDFVEKL